MAGARDPLTRPIFTAEILAVGTELLTSSRLDTNSLYLSGQLNDLGIDVRVKSAVADDAAALAHRFRDALEHADLVISTGGLGPTSDDITRDVLAGVLGLELREDASIIETIQGRFERRGITMPSINRRQALVPEGAQVLANPNGTAPGLLIAVDGRVVVILPGPPREMQPMFETFVRPFLADRAGGRRVFRRVLKIAGRAESAVEEIAQPIYSRLAGGEVPVEATILASPGLIELHLSARGTDRTRIDQILGAGVDELAAALAPAVFSTDGRSLEEAVAALLMERRQWLAVAESCTGGMVAGRLTDVPGSSAWFRGGVVAYDNQLKIDVLGVPADLLARHGAVSEAVAAAMAEGARARFAADVGVAVTGIAGPSGGTPEKPVGTVAIAVATGAGARVRMVRLAGDRQMVRQHSVVMALEAVRLAVLDGPQA